MELILKGLIFAVVFIYIGHIIKKEAVNGKLFYSNWIVWLGMFSLGFVLIMLYALFTGQVRDEIGQYLSIGILILSFGMGSIACFLEFKITLGDYNNDSISFCTPWSKCKKYKWSDITKVTYSDSMQWYLFHCKDGKIMRFSSYLTGIDEFIQFASQKNIKFEA